MNGASTATHELEMRIPPLPPGSHIELPGRGLGFYRSLDGPAGAPTVLLLHGWTATADLNWFRLYEPLAEHFRVIAPDHHGHGRGLRSRRVFEIEHAADDAVALCREIGVERAIVVGYSMGGSVAQLVWRRHPGFTEGLVLAATAAGFADTPRERRRLRTLRAIGIGARYVPRPLVRRIVDAAYLNGKRGEWEPWAIHEVSQHDWVTIAQAGGALGTFDSRPWLHEVNVPTSVIVTTRDGIVPPQRQQVLVNGIPNVGVHTVDGNHDACFKRADQFAPALVQALQNVVAARA